MIISGTRDKKIRRSRWVYINRYDHATEESEQGEIFWLQCAQQENALPSLKCPRSEKCGKLRLRCLPALYTVGVCTEYTLARCDVTSFS